MIPRLHIETVFDLDETTGEAVMRAAVRLARAIRAAFAPEGLSLWQSNGPAAFQEVPHFHLHVLPRWEGDGLLRIYPERLSPVTDEEFARQADAIKAELAHY